MDVIGCSPVRSVVFLESEQECELLGFEEELHEDRHANITSYNAEGVAFAWSCVHEERKLRLDLVSLHFNMFWIFSADLTIPTFSLIENFRSSQSNLAAASVNATECQRMCVERSMTSACYAADHNKNTGQCFLQDKFVFEINVPPS